MGTRFEYHLTTGSAEETQRLGCLRGRHASAGVVVRLNGDLGCGKTCFVQGLARGLDVPADCAVTSPTYALMHDYPGRLPLIHVDLYRINDDADAETIGLWDAVDDRTVVTVEWADRLSEHYWPKESIEVRFETGTDDTRDITIIACGLQMTDLVKKIGALWGNSDMDC